MLRRYQNEVGFVFRIVDTGMVAGAWLVSYWARFALGPFPVTKGLPSFATYASMAPLVAVLWMAVFEWMRVYESRRLFGRWREVVHVMRAHALALLLFISLAYLFEEYKYSRIVMVYFGGLSGVTLVAFRLLLRTALRHCRARGFNLRHVLAVGEGHALAVAVERLSEIPEAGLRFKGVAVDPKSTLTEVAGLPVLGTYGEIRELVQKTGVDEVLIALAPTQNHAADSILESLRDETVDVRLVPDVHRFVTLGCEIEDFDGLPVVRINDSPVFGVGAWAKRATDFTLAAIATLLLSPLLAAIAIAVKLSSPGPVLYVQERMGLDGRSFNMLKFRSMRADAERISGPQWATVQDDRRTRLGTFLRKTSLDELPQLWNVLCGDMSLVGPRPERPHFVHTFRSEIPHYMLRHKVRSGITGWAQVNGWRGNTSIDRRIECDLFYIKNWSYALDMKILVMTLWKGFVHKNAY